MRIKKNSTFIRNVDRDKLAMTKYRVEIYQPEAHYYICTDSKAFVKACINNMHTGDVYMLSDNQYILLESWEI